MTAIHTCPDRERAYAEAAELVAGLLARARAEGRSASLVLPGGGTVRHFVRHLRDHMPDWRGVHVVLADERWVGIDDGASNERLVRTLLPDGVPLAGLKTAAAEPGEAIADITSRLQPLGPPFDVVFLGVGGDGHIASLFPHGAELAADGVVVASVAPAEPRRRISLTLPALLSAGHVVSVMTDDKRAVLEQALQPGPAEAMPIRFLLRQQRVPFTLYTA